MANVDGDILGQNGKVEGRLFQKGVQNRRTEFTSSLQVVSQTSTLLPTAPRSLRDKCHLD